MVSLEMANADFRSIGLKTTNAEDCQETKTFLFAVLGWLGKLYLENLSVTPGELLSDLISFYSTYALRYSPSIYISSCLFPYKEETVNEWFDLAPKKNWPQRAKAVSVINVDKDGHKRNCYRTQNQVDFPESLADDEFEIFFHGTNHESAKDILQGGIDLRIAVELGRSEKPHDFSHKDGFYLGNSLEQAIFWARKRSPSDPAVLLFRVKKVKLRGENDDEGWNLCDPAKRKEWERVLKEFRSQNPKQSFLKDIKDYKFIEGPIAWMSKKKPSKSDLSDPRPIKDSYQLCIIETSHAELFDRSLHSVLFFSY